MVGHPDDLFMDTREMLERIRPRQRYDLALVAVAALWGMADVWTAATLRPQPPPRYAFMPEGSTIFVGDNHTGEVAVCEWQSGKVTCSKTDSAHDAWIRGLDHKDAEP